MKLIQLNIWQGHTIRNVLRFLEEEQPDILCLQEVMSSQVKPQGWPMLHCLESLRERVGLPHEFYAPVLNMQMVGVTTEFGNAILSRYRLSDQQTIFTNGSYQVGATAETEDINIRNLQIATAATEPTPVTLMNHHGHWEPTAEGSATSLERMRQVIAAAKEVAGPLILAGDLNLVPDTPPIQALERELGLRNLTKESGVATTLSELGHPVAVACDYIFVSDAVRVQRFEISDRLVSDHKALVMEFTV